MLENIPLEICLESCEDAIAAQKGGAQRVELCDNLIEGGTTPSAGMIAMTREHISIGLQVIIRPRGGDFCYSDIEFNAMKYDIHHCKTLGVDGVVFGLLKSDGNIDYERTRELIEIARPMNVTFHRAFDMCRDPYQALEELIELGVDRILTSGQEPTVFEGLDLITDLVEKADDRIIIMPGCGITIKNAKKIAERSGCKEMHVVANDFVESKMDYRNDNCFMGTEMRSAEYHRKVTSAAHVYTFKRL